MFVFLGNIIVIIVLKGCLNICRVWDENIVYCGEVVGIEYWYVVFDKV